MYNPIIPFYKQDNLYIERGEGCYLFDSEGNKYLDFESGDWAACLGHSHPAISKVLTYQSSKLIHDGLKFRCEPAEQLSLELLELLNMENGKSVFLNSGSEAVNLAINLAQQITGKELIVKIEGSYLSAFGYGNINNPKHINIPVDDEGFVNSIDFSNVAAFVFEAGSAHGLIEFVPESLIKTISEKAKQSNCFLIANEVTLGFGRTGKWFGFQHYNYKPDIVALGKALGNGYPISAVCVNENVASLYNENHFRYAQSHQNDPLGCKIASEVIKVLKRDNLIVNAETVGAYFAFELEKLKTNYSNSIIEIRARGLLLALELVNQDLAVTIYNLLLIKGFILGQTKGVLRFMPPLIISKNEINDLLTCLEQILSKS